MKYFILILDVQTNQPVDYKEPENSNRRKERVNTVLPYDLLSRCHCFQLPLNVFVSMQFTGLASFPLPTEILYLKILSSNSGIAKDLLISCTQAKE